LVCIAFCAFLMSAPPFWLAILLIVLIPFQSLLTQLLGGFGSDTRQLFAFWKELLLGIGILRSLLANRHRRILVETNRLVLGFCGLLVLVYCVTFLREPSVPAIFSFNLETRFVGVMVFFMFLELDKKRVATLLSTMVWSVGLLAVYGLIQYFWDYDRLLHLVYNSPDLYAEGIRRLYSYSLGALEPAYGAMIAILILLSGIKRQTWRTVIPLLAVLIPCLLLTYTRSAYLGLLAGSLVIAAIRHVKVRRYALLYSFGACAICALLLFGGSSLYQSNIGKRLGSIVSQTDNSSTVHKDGMKRAVQIVSEHPFGIGLGNYGTIQARFSQDEDDASKTENWVLQVAVQNGIFGAFVYIGMTVTVLVVLLRKQRRQSGHANTLTAAAGGGFVAMTIAGIMIPVWDELLPTVYAWALVGMALSTGRASPDLPALPPSGCLYKRSRTR